MDVRRLGDTRPTVAALPPARMSPGWGFAALVRLEAEFFAAFSGEVVGGPGRVPALFEDYFSDAGDPHEPLADGHGVAAGAVGEEAQAGAAAVGHGHDEVHRVGTDADVVDEAEVDDADVAFVELFVLAVAESVPYYAFGNGAVGGFAGTG